MFIILTENTITGLSIFQRNNSIYISLNAMAKSNVNNISNGGVEGLR